MKCTKCGSEISSNARFCTVCGTDNTKRKNNFEGMDSDNRNSRGRLSIPAEMQGNGTKHNVKVSVGNGSNNSSINNKKSDVTPVSIDVNYPKRTSSERVYDKKINTSKAIGSNNKSNGSNSKDVSAGKVFGVLVTMLILVLVMIIILLLIKLSDKKKESNTNDTGSIKTVSEKSSVNTDNLNDNNSANNVTEKITQEKETKQTNEPTATPTISEQDRVNEYIKKIDEYLVKGDLDSLELAKEELDYIKSMHSTNEALINEEQKLYDAYKNYYMSLVNKVDGYEEKLEYLYELDKIIPYDEQVESLIEENKAKKPVRLSDLEYFSRKGFGEGEDNKLQTTSEVTEVFGTTYDSAIEVDYTSNVIYLINGNYEYIRGIIACKANGDTGKTHIEIYCDDKLLKQFDVMDYKHEPIEFDEYLGSNVHELKICKEYDDGNGNTLLLADWELYNK